MRNAAAVDRSADPTHRKDCARDACAARAGVNACGRWERVAGVNASPATCGARRGDESERTCVGSSKEMSAAGGASPPPNELCVRARWPAAGVVMKTRTERTYWARAVPRGSRPTIPLDCAWMATCTCHAHAMHA